MDQVLNECSKDNGRVYYAPIADVAGVPATLYILNGGTWPPTPAVGDFSFDFSCSMFQVYYLHGWRKITLQDVEDLVPHPDGKSTIVSFTANGLPFWKQMATEQVRERCRFGSMEGLLSHFRRTFQSSKLKIILSRSSSGVGSHERRPDGFQRNVGDLIQGDQGDETRDKQPRLAAGPSNFQRHAKDRARFISCSVGFPEDTERIQWDGGFETHVPFAGKGCSEDREGRVVQELARRTSVEGSGWEPCGPDPEAFRVRELVAEIELDPILQASGDHDAQATERAWTGLLDEIKSHLAQSTTVVVRGCTPALRVRFSKASMALQFGDLGQRCQWIEGTLYAVNEDSEDDIPFHMTTTMEMFIDMVQDTTSCGNFLDGKDINPCIPMWATPLLDSTIAWNHTMHLRFSQKLKKNKEPPLEVEEGGPRVIRSPTWTSQGWRLATHPGFLTFPHHDCCGMCTYVIANSGAKIWAVMRPKLKNCTSSLPELPEVFWSATTLSDEGTYSDADIATVCLEPGDVMFQPPGVLHCAYTPVPSIFSGGYFYNYETMHLTRTVLSMLPADKEGSLTNDDRPGFFRTLCRMLIALRYRSKARTIGKRSLISLALMILNLEQNGEDIPKDTSGLADEERGEVAFAAKCAEALLNFMNLTIDSAEQFLNSQGPYYSAGNEEVEIPALLEGVPDPIFPHMTFTL